MAAANKEKESSHTIVLIQYNAQANSRTYLDYETLPAALDGAPSGLQHLAHAATLCLSSVRSGVRAV